MILRNILNSQGDMYTCFVDANQVGDMDYRKSMSCYVFNLFGGAISWMRNRHNIIALSTIEVEYMETNDGSEEAIWLQILCLGIGFVQKYIRLDCDRKSAIFLEKNPAYHAETKHIDV